MARFMAGFVLAVIAWADWSPDGNMEAMPGGYELLEHVPEQLGRPGFPVRIRATGSARCCSG